eukprot:Amastigsp_a512680_183.p3 type:complete len:103 gc:universal Amastigsp_a512680_183:585-277(-)
MAAFALCALVVAGVQPAGRGPRVRSARVAVRAQPRCVRERSRGLARSGLCASSLWCSASNRPRGDTSVLAVSWDVVVCAAALDGAHANRVACDGNGSDGSWG